jgi:hypothetical protein
MTHSRVIHLQLILESSLRLLVAVGYQDGFFTYGGGPADFQKSVCIKVDGLDVFLAGPDACQKSVCIKTLYISLTVCIKVAGLAQNKQFVDSMKKQLPYV